MQINFGTKEVWPLKKSECSLDPKHKKIERVLACLLSISAERSLIVAS
jgi:hypothetical protein